MKIHEVTIQCIIMADYYQLLQALVVVEHY